MTSLEGWGSTIELHPQMHLEVARLGHFFLYTSFCAAGRSVVASAPALGAGDREFESLRPDQKF